MPFSGLPQGGSDANYITLVMMVVLSLWGGLVNYLGRIKSGVVKRFNLVELIGEFTISSFAGLLVGFIAIAFDVNPYVSLALAGVAGHAGGRTVYFLDKIFEARLESFSKKIK